MLSHSIRKLLRNSPEALISISVNSVQACQCRWKVTLMFFTEGEMWHTQPSPPFPFFHQNVVRLLLVLAFKEINFLCLMKHSDFYLYISVVFIANLSDLFHSFFVLLREHTTRVGSPAAFARGALIHITKTFFLNKPSRTCIAGTHYRIPTSLYLHPLQIFTCSIPIISVT